MPLITRLWRYLGPRLSAGGLLRQFGWLIVAVTVFAFALFLAIGYEIVQRLDRSHRLSTPATWTAGSALGLTLMLIVSSMSDPNQEGRTQALAVASPGPSAAAPAGPSATETEPGRPLSTPAVVATQLSETPVPTPTATPSPPPTPSPTLAPTPVPTPQRIVETYEEAMFVSNGDRVAYRGSVGTYTWTSVAFEESDLIVRWDVDAADAACRVSWRIDPSSDDALHSTVRVEASDNEKGSRRYKTPFLDGVVKVASTCDSWVLSMEGYKPAVATGGGSGGGNCHPSYTGACLKQGIGDYDCAGGSGNGPNYVNGPVYVVGVDEFGLDGDGNGVGCQN